MTRFLSRLVRSWHARALSTAGHHSERDRIKAKARQIRAELGLPEAEALR